MRLRYRPVDWFLEASRSSREECLRHALPLPVVTSLEERVDASSNLDGAFRNLLVNSSSSKVSLELPKDIPSVEETNIYDKFLSQILPGVQPLHRSNIDLGARGVTVSEPMYHWLCSDVQHEPQIQEDDVNMTCSTSQGVDANDIRPEDVNVTCSRSQRIDTSEINEEDVNMTSNRSQRSDISEMHKVTKNSIIYMKVSNSSSCGEQSTSGPHAKELKPPRSTISEFLEIEPPLLELRDCIPRAEHWSKIVVELGPLKKLLAPGGATLSAIETKEEAACKFTVEQAWFDISALPCSPKRCYENSSRTEEARPNDIQELLQFDKACLSRQYPDKMSDQIVRIQPIETLMIPEKLDWQTMDEKEIAYPIKPNCVLQWFASHGNEIVEKEAESLRMVDFNTKIPVVDILTSKVVYHDEYPQPVLLPPGLLCDQCDSQPCCTSPIDSATGSFLSAKLQFEIPTTCDWNLSSLVDIRFAIIAPDEEILVPDLPRLYSSRSFESSVVMPELSLDDNHFQSLPVPLVTGPLDDMIAADVGRLISLNSEPSTVPATDWLYLDWHFFHALKCTNATCFSLQAQLTEASQCRPLLSTSLTADEPSEKRSERALELRLLLEEHDFPRDLSLNSHAMGAMGEDIEALVRSPLAGTSQMQGKESFRAPKKMQKPQERACKSPLQTPCATFRTCIDMIDADGFLPACSASNLLQNQWSTGGEGRNVDLEVQKYDINSASKQRPDLQNLQPLERLGIEEPESLRTAGGDLHCKSQQEIPSNDPVRRELRPTNFMESDVDFFVKARKGIRTSGIDPQITKDSKENSSTAVNRLQHISTSQPAFSTTTESDDQHHASAAAILCVHEIEISLEIRKCIVSLSSNYFALLALDEIVESTISGELKVLKQFRFDADGNSHLVSIISDIASEPASHQRQILLRGLIALHVLRHTAQNLCDYGIQVAHLYLENCFERMQFLEGYIMSSRTELEEAYNQVERGAVEDHPKLSSLDKILRAEALEANDEKYLSRRILLVADRRAFFTVVRKLLSLGLTPYQIDRKESYLHNGVLQEDSMDTLKEEVLEALTFSDCLLVSHAYLNPSFPVQRFTVIIQYADPPNSDAINSHWTRRNCDLHIFKPLVELEEFQAKRSNERLASDYQSDYQVPRAYSLGEQNAAGLGSSTDQSSSLKNEVLPFENDPPKSSSSGGAKACGRDQPVEENCSLDRHCEMIIIANISHPNDHMLTGRRSSFQKILRLEKENLQVVERELRLPVDLILSPASCLVIYTLGKLHLEPDSLKDKQTALQKDVVTHLKAISFSFRDCIMIFEGPTEFTTAALNIFTHIYAVAIALEMQFQCFASRHPEVTDGIVMHFIQAVRRSRRKPSCPIMTEGPTLAEVFLTEFPSINPLVAHAILSSGCPLPMFMSYTPEQQFATLEEYEVPKHCLDLFRAQCMYKAIATKTIAVSDCSVVESQTNQAADEETHYLHQADAQAASLPYQRPTSEVWASFPEFPPAFAISGYSPVHHVSSTYKIGDYAPAYSGSNTHKISDHSTAYSVRNSRQVSSFPDFPPISEVQGCEVEDPGEREPSSTRLYGDDDILKHSPAEVAGMKSAQWSRSLDTDDVSVYEGAAPEIDERGSFQDPQEIYAQDDINWLSKGFGSEEFRSGADIYGARNSLQQPLNSFVADYSFELGRSHWPRKSSAARVEGFERLRGGSDKLHGGDEILLDSEAEMSGHLESIPRPQNRSKPTMDDSGPVGLKRGAASFSFIPPTFFGIPRQETGLDTAFGNWNGHKRVRGVARGSMNETFNLQEDINDDRFASKLATNSTFLDDFSDVRADWLDNKASVHEEASIMSKSSMQQSRRPQTETLKASNLDRFRYRQTRKPAPGTASNNHTQAKIKLPRKPAPPRSRTQSPSVNYYLRPATIPKPAFTKKNPSDTAVKQGPEMILGCARRGSETQQRLVWRSNPSSSSSKRQRVNVISSP